MFYKNRSFKQQGFTLIELSLVVAMIGAVALSTITISKSFLSSTDINVAEYQSAVTLRYAAGLARGGVSDTDYGVHFDGDQMILFVGNNFGGRDDSKDINYDLGGVTIEPAIDVIYHKFSGLPYEDSYEINFSTEVDTDSITINSEGTIFY